MAIPCASGSLGPLPGLGPLCSSGQETPLQQSLFSNPVRERFSYYELSENNHVSNPLIKVSMN